MKRSMANLKSMHLLVLEFGKEGCTCKFVWDVINNNLIRYTLPCNFCGFNKKVMFPTNHNGRTKLKAPSYMMLNPEQQHGPTSSFSLAATAWPTATSSAKIPLTTYPQYALYMHSGDLSPFTWTSSTSYIIGTLTLVAIAKRIRPTGRYISTDLMLSDKRPSCHKTEP